MKKHYKGLAVALSAVMLAGGSFTAYAGPASEAGSPAAPSGNSGDSGFGPGGTTAAGHQQQQADTEQAAVEDTSLHVAVNSCGGIMTEA